MNREEKIAKILAAARESCPVIVPTSRCMGTDGKEHGACGFPWGVNPVGEWYVVGYVFRAPNGTTVGIRHASPEAARVHFEAGQDRRAAEFRGHLEAMDENRLAEQFAYWCERAAPVAQQPMLPSKTIRAVRGRRK